MKVKISITLDEEIVDEIDRNIFNRKFRNRSHALEYAFDRFSKLEVKEK